MMQDLIKKLLEEIPKYMGHFVQCLVDPKEFFKEQLVTENNREIVEKSLSFVILSSLIAFILSKVFPATLLYASEAGSLAKLLDDNNQFVGFVVNILSSSFQLLAVAIVIYFAWRIVGQPSNFQQCFGFVAFLASIVVVLEIFIQAIPNLAQVDPVVAKNLIKFETDAKQFKPLLESMLCKIDPNTGSMGNGINNLKEFLGGRIYAQKFQETWSIISERPLYKIATGLQNISQIALLIWVVRSWFAFGKILGASSFKIIISLIITIIGFILLLLINTMIEMGAFMMQIYRKCY
jgi:hypothetical protein